MKIFISLIISFIGMAATAAPNQEQLDQKGLQILVSNADKLRTAEGKSVTQILAETITTSVGTHNKIANRCQLDQNDQEFKCSLIILNSDDRPKGRTESSTEIRYILEVSQDGLPSDELFYLSVEVVQAG